MCRCDGKVLRLSLFERDDEPCGSLSGLHSSDIAYIQQAATHVEIKVGQTTASAQIVGYGVSNKGSDVVNVQLDNMELFNNLKSKLREENQCHSVRFILKHSYFRNLHRSLDRVTSRMIERLVPESGDLDGEQRAFQRIPMPGPDCLKLDKEYQLLALKKLMVCDSSFPFLVTGPFGTGKTRLLATAAVYFLKNYSNRVLICTSHLQSADAYIDTCFGPLMDKHCIPHGVIPIRLVGDKYNYNGAYPNLLINGFNHLGIHKIKKCRLVITSLMTAPQLIRLGVKPFTHILIDEGAQTREPEAIAPLGLADDDTKIVIAGDHLQVQSIYTVITIVLLCY